MFVNNSGTIELTKPFPKRISEKRAFDLVIEKAELMLSELEAGNDMASHGLEETCGLCHKWKELDGRGCSACPLCKNDTYCMLVIDSMACEPTGDTYTIKGTRKAVARLKEIRKSL